MKKKIYQTPSLEVLEMATDGILCQASGGVDGDSISKEDEEEMDNPGSNGNVKANRHSGMSNAWEGWQ